MHDKTLFLAVLLPLTSSIQVIRETKSPVNRTLEQSCPPGMFLFGSLQNHVLNMEGAPITTWYDRLTPEQQAKELRVTKCSKILINCALRTIWIGLMYCCPSYSNHDFFINTDVKWNAEHLELIVEQDMFYLQGCLDHGGKMSTRGKLAVFREPYRKAETKQCKVMFEFSIQRKVEYLTMRYVAMVVLLGAIGICCASLILYDCIHYGLESRPRIIIIEVDWLK